MYVYARVRPHCVFESSCKAHWNALYRTITRGNEVGVHVRTRCSGLYIHGVTLWISVWIRRWRCWWRIRGRPIRAGSARPISATPRTGTSFAQADLIQQAGINAVSVRSSSG
jgi:hypothetical protein